jgi:predicted DNA-binding protein
MENNNHSQTTSTGVNTAIASQTSSNNKKSSNLKLSAEIQKQLKTQADKYGLTQAAYVTVLIIRNVDGADEAGLKKEVNRAKIYMS